jgi:HEAT repeat protein
MARRSTQASELEVAAFARKAVEQVARSEDPAAAAVRVLEAAPDPRFQRGVLETAAVSAGRASTALVRAALQSGDPLLARTGAEQLAYLAAGPDAFELAGLCLKSSDGAVRRRGVDALENFTDPRAAALLPPALTDKEDVVRRAATVVFGLVVGTRRHALRQPLIDALSDPRSELTRAIVQNPDEQVRRQAAQSLAFTQSDAVLPALELLAKDEDDEVRQETVLCLAAISSAKAVELMATMLPDESYRVASTVIDMLAAQLGTNSGAFLAQLERALQHPLAEVRRQAVLMLDRFSRQEVEPILTKAAEDNDFEVARRAGEMLRRIDAAEGLGWLSDEIEKQGAGARAMPVWEAGDIGMRAAVRAQAPGSKASGGEDVAPMLERAITEGSATDKVQALGELTGLRDIGDSAPMRAALYDGDGSVRSSAAEALPYTRDAGLLAQVLADHPDALVRRRAAEALARNPGGVTRAGRLSATVSFAGTRTMGMELFSCFLRALADEDTGVKQQACEAIREYAQRAGLLPVRQAVQALERVADDADVSVLVQEDAVHTAEAVGKVSLPGVITSAAESVLKWRGALALQAHGLVSKSGRHPDALDRSVTAEVAAEWVKHYGLGAEQGAALARLAGGGEGALEADTAELLMSGLAHHTCAALECIAHAARALRLIGHEGAKAHLQQWCAAVEAAPKLDWGDGEAAAGHLLRMTRQRRRAWVEVRLALAALAGEPLKEAVADAAADSDDYVRLCALEECGEPAEVLRLCQAHAGQHDYAEPVGRCAAALLAAGREGAVELAHEAIGSARTDFSMELTQRLMAAAQADAAAAVLRRGLEGRPLNASADLCLAIALRGAGGSLDGLDLPDEAALGKDLEARCARLAIGAMENRPEPTATPQPGC